MDETKETKAAGVVAPAAPPASSAPATAPVPAGSQQGGGVPSFGSSASIPIAVAAQAASSGSAVGGSGGGSIVRYVVWCFPVWALASTVTYSATARTLFVRLCDVHEKASPAAAAPAAFGAYVLQRRAHVAQLNHLGAAVAEFPRRNQGSS